MANCTVVKKIKLCDTDEFIALTVLSNGGPVTMTVDGLLEKNGPGQVYTYSADAFFRRRNHYITSGILPLNLKEHWTSFQVTVVFTNMLPADDQPTESNAKVTNMLPADGQPTESTPEFRLRIQSPHRPNVDLFSPDGEDTRHKGSLGIGDSRVFILLFVFEC